MRIFVTVCGLVALTASCTLKPERLLPAGTYADANGRLGTLRVEGKFIEFNGAFNVRVSDAPAGKHEYKVRQDGTVRLYGSSNSMGFLNLACCWTWNGTVFEYSPDFDRNETAVFKRVSSP